jgi:hypothetical protein
MNTSTLRDELKTTADTAQLAAHARLAYEQKQLRECMAITQQLLQIDESNIEARVLQDAIRSDIQRDVEDARALLEDSRSRDDGQKYRKAAEIILLKILYVDPSHAEAKALLTSVKNGIEPQALAASLEARRRRSAGDDIAFTAHPEPVEEFLESSGGRRFPLILLGPLVVLLAGGYYFFRTSTPDSVEPKASPVSSASTDATGTVTAANATKPSESAPAIPSAKTNDAPLVPTVETRVPPAAATLPPPPAPPTAPAAPVTGSLSVTSAIAADIYMGDKHLGATPATLQLAAGRYTIEYRHGDLRTVMTHEIKAKRTTTAAVAFETTVQINARPWAQVFLEGTTRQALGQTPLSSVRVPVGSVLTFENPNFPTKSHRVTASDSTIQMAFP